ncbi:MAG TPA: hypothetical protein VF503_14485 [Sphingobium sp.]
MEGRCPARNLADQANADDVIGSAAAWLDPNGPAKVSVTRLMEALAIKLSPGQIRLHAILATMIDTPRNRADMPYAIQACWNNPVAVTDTIVFSASPKARPAMSIFLPVAKAA